MERLRHTTTAHDTLVLKDLGPSDTVYILSHTREVIYALERAESQGLDEAYGGEAIAKALKHARACAAWLELSLSRRIKPDRDYKRAAAGDRV